ncbi:pseudouridine synthase [Gilvimarinus algae]|uniref:Pseudouridine synthase n=1 Tax=Gilvimarinus algae TaxID=3058037 RepID=A0ABT8TLZ0_9GAMM|nr:pseudouridine synthase [Gilvimarinus sp. SDUM040014]MDO3384118.1 pseudouridine synthase [Gilvimarinus sp. SDUM040014]
MYKLLWQSDAALVVHKFAGVDFHNHQGEAGLFTAVKCGEGLDSLYPVHRLDKMTSGLVVMAKTAEANRQLCDQFASAQVEKFYLAVSAKKPAKKQGGIIGDMVSARRGAWRLTKTRDNPAKTAFFSTALIPGHRLFMVKPFTGRTHQIRVALKSVGAPILGDTLYGGAPADRAYLHAYELSFTLAGQRERFRALPETGELFDGDAFATALARLDPAALQWPRL